MPLASSPEPRPLPAADTRPLLCIRDKCIHPPLFDGLRDHWSTSGIVVGLYNPCPKSKSSAIPSENSPSRYQSPKVPRNGVRGDGALHLLNPEALTTSEDILCLCWCKVHFIDRR